MDDRQRFLDCIGSLLQDGEEPALEENDAISLVLDDIPFAFALSEESQECISIGAIAPLPEEGESRQNLVTELMQGNFCWAGTGGGVLGLDEESGLVCLCQRFFLPQTEPVVFREKLARQVGLAVYWRSLLQPEAGGRTGEAPGIRA